MKKVSRLFWEGGRGGGGGGVQKKGNFIEQVSSPLPFSQKNRDIFFIRPLIYQVS